MPHGIAAFAEIALPVAVHGTFTYAIPDHLRDAVRLGSRVEVPLGVKLTTGFVVGLPDSTTVEKVKPIRSVLDDEEPALTREIIELCRWGAEYYIAPFGEMLRVALPANMSARGKRELRLSDPEGPATAADRPLIDALKLRSLPFDAALEITTRSAIMRLRDAGTIAVVDRLLDAKGVRYDRFVVLDDPVHSAQCTVHRGTGAVHSAQCTVHRGTGAVHSAECAVHRGTGAVHSAQCTVHRDILTPKQSHAVELLQKRGGEMSVAALEHGGVSAAVLAALAKKSVIRIERRPRRHTLDAFLAGLDPASVAELRYSTEQQDAIDAIKRSLGTFSPFLLEGVTGSGKTEVYIEVMREVVRRGDQALLLVPEISLTPVFAARLKERFGERIAILHSNLSPSERYDQWWRARRGEVDVAIGPRSALFTPLESRENAARGKYTLVRMTKRVESRPLPEVEILDLRHEHAEKGDKGYVIFSNALRERLRATFDAGEQAIILMNRRGYAPYLLCRECGHEFRCRDCSVTLTVHRRAGLLICHYCGLRKPIPPRCPLCNGEVLQPIGFGTEKVEERFRRDFPDVAADVLDRDSTRKKGSLVGILDRFRRGETRALIGTQMFSVSPTGVNHHGPTNLAASHHDR